MAGPRRSITVEYYNFEAAYDSRAATGSWSTDPGRFASVLAYRDFPLRSYAGGGTMDMQLPSLDSLGLKFGTDKASGRHDYLSFYATFLEEMRHEEVRVLEVGVQFGSSLRMWEEYFPRGTIVGADIHPGVKTFTSERIRTEIVDQSNLEDLVLLGTKHGPFDVIVEDGSHMWGHQIGTLKALFPFLKSSGIFIVEDLHTNYGSLGPVFRGASGISCMDYLKKLVDRKVAGEHFDAAEEDDAFLRTYARNIRFITFLRHACIIRKDYRPGAVFVPGPHAPEDASTALVPPPSKPAEQAISIACHIGMIGDWHSHTGSIRSLEEERDIQGFILYCAQLPADSLEYRARLADGSWTQWVSSGHFAGTMGLAQAMTGFSVRLAGDAAVSHTLEIFGLFRGHDEPVRVAAGETCVSASGTGSLHGIQINLNAW